MAQTSSALQLRTNRYFVLDTNVLLHDSNSLFAFKGVMVAIPFVVLEELDEFKRDTGERGRNARAVIRHLDELRSRGPLGEGVPLNHHTSSIVRVLVTPPDIDGKFVCADSADNQIIRTAQWLAAQGNTVTFITKDINARVKANSLGIDAEDYTKGEVIQDAFYKGWIRIPMPAKQLKEIGASKLAAMLEEYKIYPNEFIVLESEQNPENYRLFRFRGGNIFTEVVQPQLSWGFGAKNIQQLMALDLLMDDQISFVSLVGSAGTGKTFLTLLVGLEKVARDHLYRKFLISRPLVALGADVGYLPGDLQEKLHNWMMPIHDNLEFIFSGQRPDDVLAKKDMHRGRDGGRDGRDHRDSRDHHRDRRVRHEEAMRSSFSEVDRLQHRGIISIEAITYMRGRSIPYQFIFIDEAQNLTPHEVKTIVSRVGIGSKIIIAGDPYQIDSPYLDFATNGLTVTTEKFKAESIFGTVFLEISERSELSRLAAEIL